MSGSLTPTVAAPLTTVEAATSLLAMMAGLSGVVTDYNQGSQVRTLAESVGSVVELEGIGAQALVLQGMAYGAMNLFGVPTSQATAATGVLTFATTFPVSGAPPVTQAVAIPVGTLAQTNGGVSFATTASGLLTSGAFSIDLPIIATLAGTAGNVAASGISGQPLTGLGYPLFVSNAAPTTGGAPALTVSQSIALFTARAGRLGLASPYAIANAVIGVQSINSSETVQFSTVFEPWLAAGSGAGSGTAGFTVFVDNGGGGATNGLLTAVRNWITGSLVSGQSGYRPAGVPFGVSGVTPVNATVIVSGTLTPGFVNPTVATSEATAAIQSYFNGLPFGVPAAQAQIAAGVANAALGYFSALTVLLSYSAASGTPVTQVSGALTSRIILSSLAVNIGY